MRLKDSFLSFKRYQTVALNLDFFDAADKFNPHLSACMFFNMKHSHVLQ